MNANAYAMDNQMAARGLFVTLGSAMAIALATAGVIAVLHAAVVALTALAR